MDEDETKCTGVIDTSSDLNKDYQRGRSSRITLRAFPTERLGKFTKNMVTFQALMTLGGTFLKPMAF